MSSATTGSAHHGHSVALVQCRCCFLRVEEVNPVIKNWCLSTEVKAIPNHLGHCNTGLLNFTCTMPTHSIYDGYRLSVVYISCTRTMALHLGELNHSLLPTIWAVEFEEDIQGLSIRASALFQICVQVLSVPTLEGQCMELRACVMRAARCAHAWLPPTPKPQSRFGPLWILCQALENPWSCGVLCAVLCNVSAVAVWRLEKRLGCCNGSCDPWRCTHMHKRSTYGIVWICTTRTVARCTSHVGVVGAAKGKRRRLFGIAAACY
jgi:hypothetical protein